MAQPSTSHQSIRLTPPRRRRPRNLALVQLRINQGLSPNELAAEAGVSGKTIRDAEAGRTIPLPRTQFAIAAVFGRLPTDIWPEAPHRHLAGGRRQAVTVIVSLVEQRLNRGLSMKQAALEAGVTLSVWSRAERGESVHPRNAHKIATFLGFQVTDIWPVEKEAA